MKVTRTRIDQGTSTENDYRIEVIATDDEWMTVEKALAMYTSMRWRPIPDEAPGDGWYWARYRDGKIGVRDVFDGQVYRGNGGYAHEWGCAGATHIAGPIEPPEGE